MKRLEYTSIKQTHKGCLSPLTADIPKDIGTSETYTVCTVRDDENGVFLADSRNNATSEHCKPNDVFSASALNHTHITSIANDGVTVIVSDVAVGDIVNVANAIDHDTNSPSDSVDGVTAESRNDEMFNTHPHAEHTRISIGIPEERCTLTTSGGLRRPRVFAKIARKYRKRRAAMEENSDMVVFTSGKGISDTETQAKEEIKQFKTQKHGFENVSIKIFLAICLGLTSYVTYVQFREYLKNEDIASIQYRKFNLEEKDMYPTFTVCFWPLQIGANFDNNHVSFIRNNITPSSYGSFLIGEEDDDPKYDQIIDEDVISSTLPDYVTFFSSYGLNGSDLFLVTYDDSNKNRNKSPVSVTFQQPYLTGGIQTCISRQVSYQKNITLASDLIIFNTTVLSEKDYIMSLYIHQPGYFTRISSLKISTRSLRKKSNLEFFDKSEYLINKVEILRKRHDSKTRCDEGLLDEVKFTRDMAIKNVGCIPAYWQTFAGDMTQELPKCKKSQYRTLYKQYLFGPKLGWRYTKPCSAMTMSVIRREYIPITGKISTLGKVLNSSIDNARIEKYKSDLKLAFKYGQDEYKEIINKRAYTVETLLGQVGGFVGKS